MGFRAWGLGFRVWGLGFRAISTYVRGPICERGRCLREDQGAHREEPSLNKTCGWLSEDKWGLHCDYIGVILELHRDYIGVIWVVVKMMVPFRKPIITRHPIFRVLKKGP